MNLLQTSKFKSKVSTVLNRDVKQNGKQFLSDGECDTAWSSDEGTPQWIVIQFEDPQAVEGCSIQFQGGFAGKNCTITLEDEQGATLVSEPFYPEDINSEQKFPLATPVLEKKAKRLKIVFGESTDFFGRIIVYDLRIF